MTAIARMLQEALASQQGGDLERAARLYSEVLTREPGNFDALQLLGIVAAQRQDHARAADLLQRALALRPGEASLHSNLGAVLRSAGRIDDAIASYREALRLAPDLVNAHYNLAIALRAVGRYDEAAHVCARVVALAPGHLEARRQLVAVLILAGKASEAVAAGRGAVAQAPQSAIAWTSLGAALKSTADYAEALECQQRAVALAPADAMLHMNLGNTLLELGESAQATGCYRAAIGLAPDDADLHLRAGLAFADQGELQLAAGHYGTAQRLRPLALEPALRRCQLMPLVFEDHAQLDRWRTEFLDEVRMLAQRVAGGGVGSIAAGWIEPPFALQFLDGDLRPLKEACAQIFQCVIPGRDPPRNTGRPRVGVVVTRRHELSFLHGMGPMLDRTRGPFELVVLCDQGGADVVRAGLNNPDIVVLPLPQRLDALADAVRAACCDVLWYWEVGTDATNYFLPFLRPAALQCTSWGVQVTTGIPAMDRYLSSSLVEPTEASAHYSERLVLGDALLTYQRRREFEAWPDPRPRLGLDGGHHLYLCAQQIGKLHPDFDAVLAGILQRDPRGVVVLLGDARASWNTRLRQRLERTMAEVAGRVVVLPRQSEADYLALVAAADVLLDAPHFAGVNSSYDAFALGRPVVHRPSPYQRGRYTLGCYRQMGLTDLVAKDEAGYVELALALGTQADFRQDTRARIAAASDALFEDARAVDVFSRMLTSLVEEVRGTA
jgi:protein O-GlcNAc transferase